MTDESEARDEFLRRVHSLLRKDDKRREKKEKKEENAR